jgi:hypothetical protein
MEKKKDGSAVMHRTNMCCSGHVLVLAHLDKMWYAIFSAIIIDRTS